MLVEKIKDNNLVVEYTIKVSSQDGTISELSDKCTLHYFLKENHLINGPMRFGDLLNSITNPLQAEVDTVVQERLNKLEIRKEVEALKANEKIIQQLEKAPKLDSIVEGAQAQSKGSASPDEAAA